MMDDIVTRDVPKAWKMSKQIRLVRVSFDLPFASLLHRTSVMS